MEKVNLFKYDSGFRVDNSLQKTSHISFCALPKCILPKNMENICAQIRNVTFKIAFGDMTKIKADAFVVPQFRSGASLGGVGGAVAREGAYKGIVEFDNFVKKHGPQEFGTVLLTKSYGGNSENLLHVVSVNSSRENEFNTIKNSVYNLLTTAAQNDIKSVACPAMGTGIIGDLTNEQSAKAILSSVKRFADEGHNLDLSVVIFNDKSMYNDFVNVLKTKSYENPANEIGKKQFDPDKWLSSMIFDNEANKLKGF